MRTFFERSRSRILGSRFWRFLHRSANTLHKHVRAGEYYYVVEGVGGICVGEETLTVPQHRGILVGPQLLPRVFNDTESEVLRLILGAPEAELEPHEVSDKNLLYPVDPTQLPKELTGSEWPPK